MGKYSSNGPDWTDVEMLMRAISAMHGGEAGLTFLPRGIGATGGMAVSASIVFNVLPGSALDSAVTVVGDWPCVDHDSLDGHCFSLLHKLDYEIGKVYKNEELWK